MTDLVERLRIAAKIHRDMSGQSAIASTIEEAADALEAAREDARTGDWVLVPRELPAGAHRHLAYFDMEAVGNGPLDSSSECWAALVEMAGKEVHKLEFSNPVFHAGTNLTVRRGTKWHGREWAALRVGEASLTVRLSTMTHKLVWLDDHWLRDEHDPACRTVSGLVAEMERVYPGFDPYEDVTLVRFDLPGPIPAIDQSRGKVVTAIRAATDTARAADGGG